MEIKTLKDLRDFLNSCTDEQLNSSAAVRGIDDEGPIYIGEASLNDEEYFYNEDSEGLIPTSEFDEDDWDGIPLSDDTYHVIVPKGTLVLLDQLYEKAI